MSSSRARVKPFVVKSLFIDPRYSLNERLSFPGGCRVGDQRRRTRMPHPNTGQSIIVAATIALSGLGILGFAHISVGAVLVGETRKMELQQQSPTGIAALKALYRRPTTIPFPKDNLYTPEKAALGKKLYFDTRLSVTSAQSCASCHSPSFGWGDGLPVGVGHGARPRSSMRRGARSSCGTAASPRLRNRRSGRSRRPEK
jgi:hypothetical protein